MNNRIWVKIKTNKASLAGACLILFFAFTALFAPLLAPSAGSDPYIMPQTSFAPEPQKPSREHFFGTAQQQYDIYHGVVWGSRTAFKVGISVTFIAVLIGVFLGSVAGLKGGIFDELIMRFTDIVLSLPAIVLAIVLVALSGPGIYKVTAALALVSWPSYARLVRADVLSVKELGYVTSAKAMGAGSAHIYFKHILPNSIYPVIIVASLDIGAVVLTAAALSFLGLGSPAGYADWGQLIALSRNWILGSAGNPFAYWHAAVIPGLAIFLFVLGWNLLGDAFRDVLDPKKY